MNEQILLEKWQTLDTDDQEKVIAFIKTLQQKNWLTNLKLNWERNFGN